MYRPTPFFIVSMITLLLVAIAGFFFITAYNYHLDQQAEEALRSTNMWHPPKIKCPAGNELWDCIRNGRYE